MSEFKGFGKIARLNRDITITEKLDGTNAQIYIATTGLAGYDNGVADGQEVAKVGDLYVWAGSRSRWLQPGKGDNFGFGGWVHDNAEAIVALLGPGRCFGEWWGAGIQRRYGQYTKRFSLFNVHQYAEVNSDIGGILVQPVPVLYRGPWFTETEEHSLIGRVWAPELALVRLAARGSIAAPGFMDPEGICIYHEASGQLFKATIKGDEKPKGMR